MLQITRASVWKMRILSLLYVVCAVSACKRKRSAESSANDESVGSEEEAYSVSGSVSPLPYEPLYLYPDDPPLTEPEEHMKALSELRENTFANVWGAHNAEGRSAAPAAHPHLSRSASAHFMTKKSRKLELGATKTKRRRVDPKTVPLVIETTVRPKQDDPVDWFVFKSGYILRCDNIAALEAVVMALAKAAAPVRFDSVTRQVYHKLRARRALQRKLPRALYTASQLPWLAASKFDSFEAVYKTTAMDCVDFFRTYELADDDAGDPTEALVAIFDIEDDILALVNDVERLTDLQGKRQLFVAAASRAFDVLALLDEESKGVFASSWSLISSDDQYEMTDLRAFLVSLYDDVERDDFLILVEALLALMDFMDELDEDGGCYFEHKCFLKLVCKSDERGAEATQAVLDILGEGVYADSSLPIIDIAALLSLVQRYPTLLASVRSYLTYAYTMHSSFESVKQGLTQVGKIMNAFTMVPEAGRELIIASLADESVEHSNRHGSVTSILNSIANYVAFVASQ